MCALAIAPFPRYIPRNCLKRTKGFALRILRYLVLTACALALAPIELAQAGHVRAELVAEQNGLPADGGTITVGLHQTIEPGWHTYWRNPGDAGEPTAITWAADGFCGRRHSMALSGARAGAAVTQFRLRRQRA